MARRAQHDPDLLTADEAAAMLGVGRGSIYAAVRRSDIPHRRIGRKVLFSRRALQRWLSHAEDPPGVPL